MSGPGSSSQETQQLGDYRVGRIVSEGTLTRTYEAEQISVRRRVLLEGIKPGVGAGEEEMEAFLADVRAKAGVDHPVIGSVIEAVQNDGQVYYAREFLQGRPMDELHEAGEELGPSRMAALLGQIGEAIHHLERRGVARLPLEPRHLFLGSHDVVRMVNLAVAGEGDPGVAVRERQVISELLLDMVAVGRPGSTRLRKLLAMLGGDDPPDWDRVAHTARKLAHEFSEGARSITAPEASDSDSTKSARRGVGLLGPLMVGFVTLGLVAGGGVFLLNHQGLPKPRDLGQMVQVTGASVTGSGGERTLIPAYWIDAHEVTIAEYGEFLAALTVLNEEQRDVYDHRAQPRDKIGHEPDDWAAMLEAAMQGGEWNGVSVTPNCPVVNVDWWDAYAYANWRGGRLPTLEEWLAAAGGSAVSPSTWGEVDAATIDRTPEGVHGLAGNVSEWVRDPRVNPAFPMNPKSPVACGASYLHPRNGIVACTWLASREEKQPDLGFRILRESAP